MCALQYPDDSRLEIPVHLIISESNQENTVKALGL